MKILNRDEFVIQVDKFNNDEEINEGLFQFLKSFFKKDWKDIKSNNSSLKDELEKIDKGLDGYTTLKRSNYDACTQFRQALCDFANDLLDSKFDEMENHKKRPLKKVIMGIDDEEDRVKNKIEQSPELTSILGNNSIKSKALRDNLQNSAEAVEDVIKKYPAIAPWATAMKRSVRNLINNAIIAQSDADDKEDIEKAVAKNQQSIDNQIEEENAEASKKQEEKLKAIADERTKTLTDIGVTPLQNVDGGKAITQLTNDFNTLVKDLSGKLEKYKIKLLESISYNVLNEGLVTDVKEFIDGDKTFGLNKIITAFIEKYNKQKKKGLSKERNELMQIYIKELNACYAAVDEIAKDKNKFKEVTGDSIQAMYVGFAYAIAYGILTKTYPFDELFTDDVFNLLARCAISSDETIGYGFPLMDEKKPDDGNIFAAVIEQMKNSDGKYFTTKDDSGKDIKDNELINQFKTKIDELYKKIIENAKKIKEEAEKEKEKELKELERKEK